METIRDARPERITTRMYKVRKDHSLTQGDVARILSINDSLISVYERGVRTPSKNHRRLLESFFEMTIDELLEPIELVTSIRSLRGEKRRRNSAK